MYVTLNTINGVFGGGLAANASVEFMDESIVLLLKRVGGNNFYVRLLFCLTIGVATMSW